MPAPKLYHECPAQGAPSLKTPCGNTTGNTARYPFSENWQGFQGAGRALNLMDNKPGGLIFRSDISGLFYLSKMKKV